MSDDELRDIVSSHGGLPEDERRILDDVLSLRDRQISARAEHTARAVLVIGALAALVLAMLEADHFWIAHALFIGFYASAVLEGITKVALYRGGVPAW